MINLKKIPKMDEILEQQLVKDLIQQYNREFVVAEARKAVNTLRQELKEWHEEIEMSTIRQKILDSIVYQIKGETSGTLRRVINSTGVVLHTNLGRAPLADKAISYMNEMGHYYNNLEMNLDKGERGSRYVHVEELLQKITGAEAALVVNNNAAAVLLGLTAFARGKEVIVSRGQLVEIGGAFRIPEVMKMSGAKLIEVGTTNKTYIRDFSEAINEETALLFSAHTSNYKIVGFTEEVPIAEMVNLGKERAVPVMQDLGSGILTDLSYAGLKEEPTVQDSIKAGADIITFSGDKLLGGPQAGVIVGKKEYIDAMKREQLLRALRVDKLTIAALEGTLMEYLSGIPEKNIPVIAMLTADRDELLQKAELLQHKLLNKLDGHPYIQFIRKVDLEDMVGGGAYPAHRIPGAGVAIAFNGISLEEVAHRLRSGDPAMVMRRQEDHMLLSVRTLFADDYEIIPGLIHQALSI